MAFWAVARTEPHREATAARFLGAQDFETYLPVIQTPPLRGQTIRRTAPLFPGSLVMTETIPIDEADYAFIAAAARQLHPTQRPVFATRVHALLQHVFEPGPGDVDRAVRMALRGISGTHRSWRRRRDIQNGGNSKRWRDGHAVSGHHGRAGRRNQSE
jgi:hypothetical protein